MIFGNTHIERLRDRIDCDKEMRKWRKWYAWYPVNIKDGRTAWLERVEKRYIRPHFGWRPEYRLIEKVGEE